MQSAQNNSRTKIIGVGVVVVAILIILGGAAYAVMQLATQEQNNNKASSEQSGAKNDKNVTKQTLNQGMTDLDETVKQTKEAHSEAEAAVNDSNKRVKVSE